MNTFIFLGAIVFSEIINDTFIETLTTIFVSNFFNLIEVFHKDNKIQEHIEVEVVIAFSTLMSLLFRELLEIPVTPRLIRKKISRFSFISYFSQT